MVDAWTSQGAGLYTANVVFNQPILMLDHEWHSSATVYLQALSLTGLVAVQCSETRGEVRR